MGTTIKVTLCKAPRAMRAKPSESVPNKSAERRVERGERHGRWEDEHAQQST